MGRNRNKRKKGTDSDLNSECNKQMKQGGSSSDTAHSGKSGELSIEEIDSIISQTDTILADRGNSVSPTLITYLIHLLQVKVQRKP